MGKKSKSKSGEKASNDAPSVADSTETASIVSATEVPNQELENVPSSSPPPVDLATNSASAEPGEPEGLREQLQKALKEIHLLKAQLAERDAELAAFKSAALPPTTPSARSADLQRLQEKLALLKKEQAEADAAREAAWRQLKSVVGEIGKIADVGSATSAPSTPSGPAHVFVTPVN